jgi:hypothetical protein
MGVWDHNSDNDFLLQDGTQFACGQQINQFGESWAIRNNTSLFFTVNSTSPTPQGNASLTPANDPEFNSPEDQAHAQAICGGLPAAMQAGMSLIQKEVHNCMSHSFVQGACLMCLS